MPDTLERRTLKEIIISLRGGANPNNASLSFSELPPEAEKLLRTIQDMDCWARFARQGNVVELRRKCEEPPLPLPWESLKEAIFFRLQAHRKEHTFSARILVCLQEKYTFTDENKIVINGFRRL